jgi:hypothetical protein
MRPDARERAALARRLWTADERAELRSRAAATRGASVALAERAAAAGVASARTRERNAAGRVRWRAWRRLMAALGRPGGADRTLRVCVGCAAVSLTPARASGSAGVDEPWVAAPDWVGERLRQEWWGATPAVDCCPDCRAALGDAGSANAAQTALTVLALLHDVEAAADEAADGMPWLDADAARAQALEAMVEDAARELAPEQLDDVAGGLRDVARFLRDQRPVAPRRDERGERFRPPLRPS